MKKRMLSLAVLAASLFCFSDGANAQKTEKLFNGKDLSNWNFVVDKNSVPPIRSIPYATVRSSSPASLSAICTPRRNTATINCTWNGVGRMGIPTQTADLPAYRDLKNPFPNGIECNLQAGRAGLFVLLGGSDLVEYQQRPGEERPFFPVVKNVNPSSEKPAGEWNEANIFVKDGVITVYINGVYQNTGTNKVKEGHIGLQSEGKEVEFRNVTLTKW